jgi:hypothetical protein
MGSEEGSAPRSTKAELETDAAVIVRRPLAQASGRLEGWQQARCLLPSVETFARQSRANPQDDGCVCVPKRRRVAPLLLFISGGRERGVQPGTLHFGSSHGSRSTSKGVRQFGAAVVASRYKNKKIPYTFGRFQHPIAASGRSEQERGHDLLSMDGTSQPARKVLDQHLAFRVRLPPTSSLALRVVDLVHDRDHNANRPTGGRV